MSWAPSETEAHGGSAAPSVAATVRAGKFRNPCSQPLSCLYWSCTLMECVLQVLPSFWPFLSSRTRVCLMTMPEEQPLRARTTGHVHLLVEDPERRRYVQAPL